jgi:hypothetical protein
VSLGNIVKKIASVAWKQPNDYLLETLKVDSDILEQQMGAFSSVSETLPLVCVYEELPTHAGMVS